MKLLTKELEPWTYRGADIYPRYDVRQIARWYCRTTGSCWSEYAPAILWAPTKKDMQALIREYRT